MLRQPNVLLFTTKDSELSLLQPVLGDQVELTPVGTLPELISRLEDRRYDALFCGTSLPAITRHDIRAELQDSNPELPVISLCESEEWMRLLEVGALDLLVQEDQEAPEMEDWDFHEVAAPTVSWCA